jgi:hypothetical protein
MICTECGTDFLPDDPDDDVCEACGYDYIPFPLSPPNPNAAWTRQERREGLHLPDEEMPPRFPINEE